MSKVVHIHKEVDDEGVETELEVTLPDWDWLWETFDSKSKAIRYMHFERKIPIAIIARFLGLNYRHVYSVILKAKRKQEALGNKCCPVCGQQKL